jgi:lycopene cyclase domain-containing protein
LIPEYTIGAAAAAAVTVWMDLGLVRTRVLADRRMPVVGALVLLFMALSNGWLTARPVVLYEDAYRALPRVGSIPLEDFLYGFALVIQSLIWWTRATSRAESGPPRRPSGGR